MRRDRISMLLNRKAMAIIMLICFVFTLSACGNGSGDDGRTVVNSSNQGQSQSENVNTDEQINTSAPDNTSSSKVLVAYFAFSENIGDTSAMGVDAITSASLNRRTDNTEGNLQVMAQAAAEETGRDLFSIVVTEPYNPEYNSMAGADVKDGFTISADTDNEKVLNEFKEYLAAVE